MKKLIKKLSIEKLNLKKAVNWVAIVALLSGLHNAPALNTSKFIALTFLVQHFSSSLLYAPESDQGKGLSQVHSSSTSWTTLAQNDESVSYPIHSTGTYSSVYSAGSTKRSGTFGATETFVLKETPRKVLIPNSPIKGNATFVLTFDNPSANIISQAKIYDITGAEVADFTELTPSGSDPTTVSWDGRNKNGSIVRSGIYIYQIQAEGQVVNGTVVVAK